MGKKGKIASPAMAVNSQERVKNSFSIVRVRLVLFLAIILIYGNTLDHGFTLDDDVFYLKHGSVQKGMEGMPEVFANGSMNKFDGTTGTQPYRPVTLVYFIFQKIFFDNDAYAAHTVNVLMYVLISFLLYGLLKKLWSDWHPLALLLVSLLFVAHPVHTEVVASVKSADELLAAFFGLLSWYLFIPEKRGEPATFKNRLFGTVIFLFALLSKESAIAWLVIIPLAGYMLSSLSIRSALNYFLVLLPAVAVFFWLRYNALGTAPPSNGEPLLNNVLYGAKNLAELTATKAEILFHYIRLLFLPWPLSWDYSYNQIPVVGWTDLTAIAGTMIYMILGLAAVLLFRRQTILSFCILFFFISSSPTNNLFIYNGATVGERFLFIPSLALAIALPVLLASWLKLDLKNLAGKGRNNLILTVALIVTSFSLMSFVRSKEWESNLILFEKGVERSPNSSRTHYSLATEYMSYAQKPEFAAEREEYFRKAIRHFDLSLRIYPDNMQAHYNSGICYSLIGDTTKAIYYYKEAIRSNPEYVQPINNLGVLYQAMRNVDSAKKYYELAYRISPGASIARKNLGDIYFLMGQLCSSRGQQDSALGYYRTSLGFNSGNVFLLNNIASIFSSKAGYDSALYYLNKGYALDPNSLMIIENIAAVSFLNKEYEKAIEYGKRGLGLNPRARKSSGVLMDTYNATGKREEAEKFRLLYQSLN